MAMITEQRQLFVNELNAMLYVEQRLAKDVLPELAGEITNQEFKQNVQHHIDETRQQIANLERVFELLGEEPKPDKSHAVDGLVAQHDKVVKNIDSAELRDIFDASAAAKTEHLEIAAYESLITTADSLGDSEVVSLLEENLDQEKHTLKEVEKISQKLAKETTTV
jgi:ferritin-like metal-binding protein YciE